MTERDNFPLLADTFFSASAFVIAVAGVAACSTPFMRYTAYARVGALRIKGCAEHNNAIVIADRIFRDFIFIGLFFVRFSQPGTQTDARAAANSKKI